MPATPSSLVSVPSSPTTPNSPTAAECRIPTAAESRIGFRQPPPTTPCPARRPLLRVVLDTHLRIPLHLATRALRCTTTSGSSSAELLILCGVHALQAKAVALGSLGVEVEHIPDYAGRLSLPAVLSTLATRNIISILLECGSHLNGAFLQQNLVDKAALFYAPTELGPAAIPFAEGIAPPNLFEQSLTRITRTTYGPDTCITGYLHDPWPN